MAGKPAAATPRNGYPCRQRGGAGQPCLLVRGAVGRVDQATGRLDRSAGDPEHGLPGPQLSAASALVAAAAVSLPPRHAAGGLVCGGPAPVAPSRVLERRGAGCGAGHAQPLAAAFPFLTLYPGGYSPDTLSFSAAALVRTGRHLHRLSALDVWNGLSRAPGCALFDGTLLLDVAAGAGRGGVCGPGRRERGLWLSGRAVSQPYLLRRVTGAGNRRALVGAAASALGLSEAPVSPGI